jgi:glycosyltransferase involved in cell wall biosynthesis
MARAVYARSRGSRLRVRLGPGLTDAEPRTGHGNVWRRVLAELYAMPDVKLIDRGRADVWLASGHSEPPDGRPLVVEVHEIGWDDPWLRSLLHPDFARKMEGATRAALGAASRVITPSLAASEQVMRVHGWPSERVHTVHHGVDHRLFRPGRPGGRALVGAPYVLFVGVLHPRKNLTAVRQAVAGLAARGLPHVLAIVGNRPRDREDASALERQAEAELPGHPGRVVLLREVSDRDLAALMAGADAFCLPSYFEGFGLPALEAMACGAPVVVSNRGALPEVVADAGLVVEPDAVAVEDALRLVLAQPGLAERLRHGGLQRAAAFTWRSTAEGWLEALRAAAQEA